MDESSVVQAESFRLLLVPPNLVLKVEDLALESADIVISRIPDLLGGRTHQDAARLHLGLRGDERPRRDDAPVAEMRPLQYDRSDADQ